VARVALIFTGGRLVANNIVKKTAQAKARPKYTYYVCKYVV